MVGSRRSTSAAQRLPFIDSLRGFALLGVFGANLMVFSGFTLMSEDRRALLTSSVWDRLAETLELLLVENKFMGLFSILFGISFWLFLDRVRGRAGAGSSGVPLFYRRIVWLFVFGAVHGWLLWAFDILRFYALWALLLPLFLRMPLRRLLWIGLGAAVVGPALVAGLRGWLPPVDDGGAALDALTYAAFAKGSYPQVLAANWRYDWYLTESLGQVAYQLTIAGRLLLGLFAARAFDLADLEGLKPLLRKMLLGGTIVGAVGNSIFAFSWLADVEGFFLPFLRRLLVEGGFLGLTLAYASALALLFLRPRWRSAIQRLAPLGQMALTAYLGQTLFGVWLFYGFSPGPHCMGDVGPALLGLIWIVGYLVQVLFASLWMRRFRFGPAEWLWRSLTYGRPQPMRIDRVSAA